MRSTIITRSKTIKRTNNNYENTASNTTSNNDIFFERKIEEATAGLSHYYSRVLSEKISKEDALIIVQYIFDLRSEI
ncbi:MAG: hypothetical protein ACJ72Q_03020, partial [Nitrososphaeraceae archaeon]